MRGLAILAFTIAAVGLAQADTLQWSAVENIDGYEVSCDEYPIDDTYQTWSVGLVTSYDLSSYTQPGVKYECWVRSRKDGTPAIVSADSKHVQFESPVNVVVDHYPAQPSSLTITFGD